MKLFLKQLKENYWRKLVYPSELIETGVSYKIPMKERWKARYPEGTKEVVEHMFIAKIDTLELPRIDPIEHDEWKWCSFEEAMDLLYLDNNKTALEQVKRFLVKN